MEETLFTEQEQGHATDLLSVALGKDEHQAGVLAAVQDYFPEQYL